jgi:hypothetical protein
VYATHYVFSGIPEERILHNFLVYLHFQGVTPETASEYLDKHEKRIWAVLFRDWRDIFFHQHDPYLDSISDKAEIRRWVESKKDEIQKAFVEFYAEPIHDSLGTYALTYVVWDRSEGTPPPEHAFLKKVFESNNILVYRFI